MRQINCTIVEKDVQVSQKIYRQEKDVMSDKIKSPFLGMSWKKRGVTLTVEKFVVASRFGFPNYTLHSPIGYLSVETLGRNWRMQRTTAALL